MKCCPPRGMNAPVVYKRPSCPHEKESMLFRRELPTLPRCLLMMPTIDYEHSIAPAPFTKIWRERIESKPQLQSSNLRRSPSPTPPQDADCPFEYDHEYLPPGDTGGNIGETRHPLANRDDDADLPSLAGSEVNALRHDAPQLTVALIGGSLQ